VAEKNSLLVTLFTAAGACNALTSEPLHVRARDCASRHVVVFMHIPIFVDSIDEENNKFSLKQEKRVPLLERFADARVTKVFHGHCHRNAGGVWTRTNSDGSESKVFCSVVPKRLKQSSLKF